ncbi:tRNA pseudouridine(55) synthase TruB [Candidatus Peregrinibacteria bacterium]|nr:tRNA pseudouridine(55) synthase TruB [Candidatus Peregrinibacteria bacterium]
MIGFLLIDKEKGATSFSCVSAVRKFFDTRKVGFVGTLDPLASGLMIVAVGEGTKMISYLEGLDKTYETIIQLGATSSTYDGEGEIQKVENPKEPTLAAIEQILQNSFSGEEMQIPPIHSAIQIGGKRAYDLARKGEDIAMKPRKVVFHKVDILDYEWPILRVRLKVSSGTYVRSFAHDLGELLGCGGYVKELRRTHIANFSVSDARMLQEIKSLKGEAILPVDAVFSDWEQIELSVDEIVVLNNGGFIDFNVSGEGPFLGMLNGQCVGVLEKRGHQLKYRRKFLLQEG